MASAPKHSDKPIVKKVINVMEHKYSPLQVPVWIGEDCYMMEHQDYRKIEDTRHISYSKYTEKGFVPIDVNNESNNTIVSAISSAANNLYSLDQPTCPCPTENKREAAQNKEEHPKIAVSKEKTKVHIKKGDICETFHPPKFIPANIQGPSLNSVLPQTANVPPLTMPNAMPMQTLQINRQPAYVSNPMEADYGTPQFFSAIPQYNFSDPEICVLSMPPL